MSKILGSSMFSSTNLEQAKQMLHEGNYTCVFYRGEEVITDSRRGVTPLLCLLESEKNLHGFCAADKVVGKAAAFLYCALEVNELYADVISEPALEVLRRAGISVEYANAVKAIRNRTNTSYCPMETAVWNVSDTEEAIIMIRQKQQELMSH